MRDELDFILKSSFEQIEAKDSTLICSVYSKLYKNGQVVRNCISSRKQYYREIQLTGLKKNEIMESKKTYKVVKNRESGLTRISNLETPHVILSNLSDERTIKLLKEGSLKEEWYEKLPEGYKVEEVKAKVTKDKKEKKEKLSKEDK